MAEPIALGMQFTAMVVPAGTAIPLVMVTCAFTTPATPKALSVPLKFDPVKPNVGANPNTGAAWRESEPAVKDLQ